MAGRPLRHPEIGQVTVVDVLHALSDPVRLGIVCELMRAESSLNCVETIGRVGKPLPKSTCSQHYQILREAGLIRCERKGVELCCRLRLPEVEARFPGLLKSILAAYDREKGEDCPRRAEGGGPTGAAAMQPHAGLSADRAATIDL